MKENELQDEKPSELIKDDIETTTLSELNIQNIDQGNVTTLKVTFLTSLLYFFFPCLKSIDRIHRRKIYINTISTSPRNYTKFPNILKSQKYNIITFLPLSLFYQFKVFNNQFNLLMASSQLINALKVGFLFTYITPLLIILTVSLIREAIDDIKRYRRDKEQNTKKFVKVDLKGKKTYNSEDIHIGDIIEINKGERVPCDILILCSNDKNIYVKTDQLDGETDWKLRKPMTYFQNIYMESNDKGSNLNKILTENCHFIIEPPSKNIYEFNGVLEIHKYSNNNSINNNINNDSLNQNEITKQSINLENTIWMNCILTSNNIYGLVIYTGKETRAEMNSSLPKNKFGKLEEELNHFSRCCFVLMIVLALIVSILKGINNIKSDFIIFVRFVIIFCSIIPISLKINIDICKTYFSTKISNTKKIEGAIARNSTIPEELGRIDYIFSDKTGTLTKNIMKFKLLSTEVGNFSDENINDIKLMLNDECKNYNYPCGDLINNKDKEMVYNSLKRIRRNKTKIIRDSITVMCLCNNVTPIYNETNNEYDYQASSPDEISLVKFASSLGMQLKYRDDEYMNLLNCNGFEEKYKIIAIFPFSSETKRMGIVLHNLESDEKIFYCKGAENVISNLVKSDYKPIIKENAEALSIIGLRTLVLTQKLIDNDFFEKWYKKYQEAMTSLDHRKKKIEKCMKNLEKNLEFLCVTGVEDELQDEVNDTIETLKNAGIKIWMLTGDKVETATCIAISSGLKSKNQKLFYLKDLEDKNLLIQELNKLQFQNDFVLIIDGAVLDLCLNHCSKNFFDISLNAKSVVCCRCSPTQKAKIIKIIKQYTKNKKRCLAIGDGGNDVSMIFEAHVGVGIVGKEGKQASLSADYSINNFKDLKILILWFGRLSYKNSATISKYIIHRGLIISVMEFIFIIMFYYVPIALYNGVLMFGYTTIFTSLPVFTLIFDRDTNLKNVLKFPSLYIVLQKGREFSNKNFLIWFFKSIFQASFIMFISVFYLDNIFLKIMTVTYSSLVILELLNIYSEIKHINWEMILSLIITLATYLFCLFFLRNVLDVYYIDLMNFLKILGITFISWLPFYLGKKFKKIFFPETHEKLNILSEEI